MVNSDIRDFDFIEMNFASSKIIIFKFYSLTFVENLNFDQNFGFCSIHAHCGGHRHGVCDSVGTFLQSLQRGCKELSFATKNFEIGAISNKKQAFSYCQ